MKNNPSPEEGLWALRNTQKVGSKIWEGKARRAKPIPTGSSESSFDKVIADVDVDVGIDVSADMDVDVEVDVGADKDVDVDVDVSMAVDVCVNVDVD